MSKILWPKNIFWKKKKKKKKEKWKQTNAFGGEGKCNRLDWNYKSDFIIGGDFCPFSRDRLVGECDLW